MTDESNGGKIPLDRTPTAEDERKEFRGPEEERADPENQQIAQDIRQRKKYDERAFYLTIAWAAFVAIITLAQFFGKKHGYSLESGEFIAVIVSVTTSMFGFWILVGRYLFPRR